MGERGGGVITPSSSSSFEDSNSVGISSHCSFTDAGTGPNKITLVLATPSCKGAGLAPRFRLAP
jgi:hypothetical protein